MTPNQLAEVESTAQQFCKRLTRARLKLKNAAAPGARKLPVLKGMTKSGISTRPLENVYAEATQILNDSGRIYSWNGEVVMEANDNLIFLTSGGLAVHGAHHHLSNFFVLETPQKEDQRAH